MFLNLFVSFSAFWCCCSVSYNPTCRLCCVDSPVETFYFSLVELVSNSIFTPTSFGEKSNVSDGLFICCFWYSLVTNCYTPIIWLIICFASVDDDKHCANLRQEKSLWTESLMALQTVQDKRSRDLKLMKQSNLTSDHST